MYKTFLITFFISLGLCITTTLSAQTILYEENFSTPGFPAGWTTNDLSGQDVIWSWCADPTTGQMDGCPRIWEGGTSNQMPFSATSAENGFFTLDSDPFLGISQPHISQLTSSAFDFTGEETVWVKFETHLGVFNTTPNNNAILRVINNDNSTFEIFNCFPEFPQDINVDNRWSANPKTIYFNVSEVAANQSSITFQWQWKGKEEYHWSIDDFQVSDGDPRPEVDLVLTKKSFLIPENAMIPIFEISPISLGAKIRNQGSEPQLDSKLAIVILNNNNEIVFTDTLTNETLAVDEESDFLLFENTFTPPNNAVIYEGIYTLLPTSPDATPANNIQKFSFEISENILGKERQVTPQRSTAPLNTEWAPLEPHSWAWGNYFFIKNGQGQLATSAIFSIANPEVLGGRSISLSLSEWTDLDDNDMAETSERNLIAFAQYDITGSEPNDELLTIPLLAFPDAKLKDNQGYLLMIDYFAEDDANLFINYSDKRDYEATLTHLENSGTTAYASMLGIGNPLGTVAYTNFTFGPDRTPMVRLETQEIVGVQDVLPEAFKLEISPNPTVGEIGIQFDFPETLPSVSVRLFNQSGKLLITKNLTTIRNERSVINGNKLPAGVYYVEIITDFGKRTLRVLKVN